MSCWVGGWCLGGTSYSSWSDFTVSYTYTCPTRVGTTTWTQTHMQVRVKTRATQIPAARRQPQTEDKRMKRLIIFIPYNPSCKNVKKPVVMQLWQPERITMHYHSFIRLELKGKKYSLPLLWTILLLLHTEWAETKGRLVSLKHTDTHGQ